MNFTDIVSPVLRHAAARPDHAAFVFNGESLSYGALAEGARRAATALLDAGVEKGDRVAMLSANRPEIFSLYLGVAMIGAAIVPVNADFAPHEVNYVLAHSGAKLLISADELAQTVERAVDGLEPAPARESFDGFLARARAAEPYAGPQAGSGEDLALLCYTSGTTSTPKGVAATHANELASGLAYSGMWCIAPEDRLLVTLPLTFSFGFHAATYVALLSGATVLLAAKFHPRLALEAIESLRPTVFLGVPTMYAMMADVARKDGRRFDVSSLRLCAASGAALNEQIVADCRRYIGITVRPYYAMTEVRPIFSFDLRQERLRPESRPPAGSVGRLIAPTEIRLVDESGADVAEGEVGELRVRGPSFSGAYYRDPVRTAGAMTDGWFLTGDLVTRDEEGNFFIVGRNRDQIISGGAKIAPIEVEDALLVHPGIAAAAVVGSPDPVFGQVVKAVVVKADPGLSEEDVVAHCRGLVADYKVPRIVAFIDELPIAPSGKVQKSMLV
ncbi:MAG: class I adenylate-forming enzyme family protein [Pseudochelatococcus sp.]|jgi:long-chain acyl-CoA synthetase|uniref:class I adenylate-forming enzyme family protein n=1 Tax=Pseudochelatococcus sp. TaxID=2020869 RepID=UPI003D92017B